MSTGKQSPITLGFSTRLSAGQARPKEQRQKQQVRASIGSLALPIRLFGVKLGAQPIVIQPRMPVCATEQSSELRQSISFSLSLLFAVDGCTVSPTCVAIVRLVARRRVATSPCAFMRRPCVALHSVLVPRGHYIALRRGSRRTRRLASACLDRDLTHSYPCSFPILQVLPLRRQRLYRCGAQRPRILRPIESFASRPFHHSPLNLDTSNSHIKQTMFRSLGLRISKGMDRRCPKIS